MKKLFFLGFLFCFLLQVHAQDQSFVNPTQSLLYVNPSFAGSNGMLRDQFAYRNLWPTLAGNSITFYNGLDGYSQSLHGGIGISALMNRQMNGTYRSSQLNFIYAPYFEYKKTGIKIIPSLQLSYLQTSVELAGLSTSQQTSGLPPSNKKSTVDATAGLLFNYKNFYLGGAIFHLNQPDVGVVGVSKLPARFSANTSYNVLLNEKTLINLSAIYTSQSTYNYYQLAVNAIFARYFMLGFGFMSQETPFVNVGFRNKQVSFMLGYDVSYSKLYGNTAGSWQLSLGLSFLKKEDSATPANFEKW